MKLQKKTRRITLTILGVILLLSIILVIHIATAKPIEADHATWQISRIDFKLPVDSITAKSIKKNLKTIEGVKNMRLNPETGVLVFFHDNRIIDCEGVYSELMKKGSYTAERFIVAEELSENQVCPVRNTNSFSYKLSRGIQRIFK